MQLIMSLTSPYARKVRVVLLEKALPFEGVVDIPWNPDTQVPDFNPLGKVPVLHLQDGTMLYDSRVIVQFLEQYHPEPALLPQGMSRVHALRVEALADGIIDASVAIFLERKRPPAMQDAAWINRQAQKIERGLLAAEGELAMHAWCVDGCFGLADIALGCMLEYLDLRLDLPWRDQHPRLANLLERLNQRPAFAETAPPRQ
ncbi:glutathione S-transferase N-terminal domain-containing protein [Thermithiobacillus plumbiphilus]|uniref:Glutathione S-transferase N-terminal domain-containing protein n=1 Tax=Thermithiobacillus plumbiphilus TaxID=1729899 RepID=A0ABU9DBY7_9PROT